MLYFTSIFFVAGNSNTAAIASAVAVAAFIVGILCGVCLYFFVLKSRKPPKNERRANPYEQPRPPQRSEAISVVGGEYAELQLGSVKSTGKPASAYSYGPYENAYMY